MPVHILQSQQIPVKQVAASKCLGDYIPLPSHIMRHYVAKGTEGSPEMVTVWCMHMEDHLEQGHWLVQSNKEQTK